MAFLAKTVCTWEKSPWTATTCHGAGGCRRREKGQEGEQGKKMRQALNIFRLDRGQRVQGSNQNPGPSRGLRSRISVPTALCAFCKVRCHCIFYGPGIRYSGIFCVPCISSGYSDIFWHISVVDTVAYFGGNHGSRVWKSLKLKKVYFQRTQISWDKNMFNRIVFFKF